MVYVFLIGTGRCGSSLVHRLLARHPTRGSSPTWRTACRACRQAPDAPATPSIGTLPVPDSGTSWLRYAPSEAY